MERIAGGTWIPRPIELCDVSSGYVACPLLLFFPSARVNCFQSSVCCAVHVALVCFQLESLSRLIIMDTDTLHAHPAGLES